MYNSKTIFIAGHARLPQGMAAKSMFETLSITAEVDIKYGVILKASCTLATEQGRNFIGELLRGFSLNEGTAEASECIQNHYRGKASKTLVAALKDLEQHYLQQK
ncbi:DUF3870 domain-containing protein [Virgibacillus alimentarius]|uniref:DUF3870 domain-containing protein n=1 Tax=Virgibacillus alimentarius TaxID=698769 RepID=A0ABS4S5E4_9BACI|nr:MULTISPECIES: DUF3870 domain-containing protein [Virgibacillus]MBP2256723.1 hypothetical protein [Virgibacillus alimentarius]HLR65592.1 DUF3870 domain-containing protein [Virgibacillus sp.]